MKKNKIKTKRVELSSCHLLFSLPPPRVSEAWLQTFGCRHLAYQWRRRTHLPHFGRTVTGFIYFIFFWGRGGGVPPGCASDDKFDCGQRHFLFRRQPSGVLSRRRPCRRRGCWMLVGVCQKYAAGCEPQNRYKFHLRVCWSCWCASFPAEEETVQRLGGGGNVIHAALLCLSPRLCK